MSIKEIVVGGVVTLVIGGTAYTVNKSDVAKNMAEDTGMSQQQADEYVAGVKEEDLVAFTEVGNSYVNDGQEVLTFVNQIDCPNYSYDWESPTLTCQQGKTQLYKLANDEISLGHAYVKLDSKSASRLDISTAVGLVDTVNSDLDFEIVSKFLDAATLSDTKNVNSYNKATLEAALESNQ